MSQQPTPEDQLKSIDQKLAEKKARKSTGLGRGKYKRKTPQPVPITPIQQPVSPALLQQLVAKTPEKETPTNWPTIYVKRKKDSHYEIEYQPDCLQAYKLLYAMDRLIFSEDLIAILKEIGIKIIDTNREGQNDF